MGFWVFTMIPMLGSICLGLVVLGPPTLFTTLATNDLTNVHLGFRNWHDCWLVIL